MSRLFIALSILVVGVSSPAEAACADSGARAITNDTGSSGGVMRIVIPAERFSIAALQCAIAELKAQHPEWAGAISPCGFSQTTARPDNIA